MSHIGSLTALGRLVVMVISPDGLQYGVFTCDKRGNWQHGMWFNTLAEARARRSWTFKRHRKLANEQKRKEGVA